MDEVVKGLTLAVYSDTYSDTDRWVCREQFDAVRHGFAEAMYCNRQLHTVLHMREIEIAEQANLIEHLRRRVRELQPEMYADHLFAEVSDG